MRTKLVVPSTWRHLLLRSLSFSWRIFIVERGVGGSARKALEMAAQEKDRSWFRIRQTRTSISVASKRRPPETVARRSRAEVYCRWGGEIEKIIRSLRPQPKLTNDNCRITSRNRYLRQRADIPRLHPLWIFLYEREFVRNFDSFKTVVDFAGNNCETIWSKHMSSHNKRPKSNYVKKMSTKKTNRHSDLLTRTINSSRDCLINEKKKSHLPSQNLHKH